MTRNEYCSKCDSEYMDTCLKRDCPLFVDQPGKSAEDIFAEYDKAHNIIYRPSYIKESEEAVWTK